MKRLLVLFLVLSFVACGASVANAVVLISTGATNLGNGSLDDTYPQLIIDAPDPDPDFFLPKPTVWINEGSRAISGPYEDELSSEPWAGPAPTPVTTHGNGFPNPDGCGMDQLDCAVFFKPFTGNATDGAATGHLYQDNPGTPGMVYILSGWAGAEANALGDLRFAVEFLDGGGGVIGGTDLSLLGTLKTPNGEPFNYKKYTLAAVAPAGTVSVRARASMVGAMGNPLGGGQAFVVDDFTLECVPEPASIALVAIGMLGLLGFARRR